MISRRDALIGGACVAAAGAAFVLKPHRELSLLAPGQKIAAIVPGAFGKWISRDVSDLFAPPTEDSLQARLYGETVGRLYANSSTGVQVLMLLAHGDVQSNELQLHRPEVCYPAFGLTINSTVPTTVPLSGTVNLPSRALIAQSAETKVATIYWTRLGEYLPVSGTEQRLDRLRTAVAGYIPDGLLARFSTESSEPARMLPVISEFIQDLVLAVQPAARRPLIGSARATALASIR
jgi:EpsI family protein